MAEAGSMFWAFGIKTDLASIAEAVGAIQNLKNTVKTMAIGITGAVGSVFAIAETTARYAEEVSSTSQALGITTTALQEYRFAAEQTGVSSEAMSTGLRFLNRNLLNAKEGGSEAIMAFHRMGVEFRDGAGHIRSTDAVLGDLAEQFKNMPEGPEKSARAMRLFGRGGADMIPFLNAGREGIADLRKEAERLGLVLSEEDTKKAKEFGDQMNIAKSLILSLKRDIGVALIPALKAVVLAFKEWIGHNRELLKQRLGEFFKFAASTAFMLIGFVKTLVGWFEPLIKNTAAFNKAMQAVIGAMVILTAAKMITNLGRLLKAFKEIRLASVGTAVLWLLAAGALEELYLALTGNPEDVDTLFGAMMPQLEKFALTLEKFIAGVREDLENMLPDWAKRLVAHETRAEIRSPEEQANLEGQAARRLEYMRNISGGVGTVMQPIPESMIAGATTAKGLAADIRTLPTGQMLVQQGVNIEQMIFNVTGKEISKEEQPILARNIAILIAGEIAKKRAQGIPAMEDIKIVR